MRRIGYWISVSIVASIFLMGCAKVKTGQRIKCPNCGRIVQDTVKEINAPFWDKDKHQVITGEQYCDTCGNQTVIVKTGTTRLCESCGRTISRNIRSMEVKRKDMQLYKVEEEKKGFCSETCRLESKYGKIYYYSSWFILSNCKVEQEFGGFKISGTLISTCPKFDGDFSAVFIHCKVYGSNPGDAKSTEIVITDIEPQETRNFRESGGAVDFNIVSFKITDLRWSF